MRLFLAIRLPHEVVVDLDQALTAARASYPDVRWLPSQRWHLTLAFFGEVPEGRLPALRARISRRVGRPGDMALRLGGAGRFGDRIVWIGVHGETEQLTAVAQSVALDNRPYRPHLTVARSRQHTDLRPVVEQLAGYSGPHWSASELELIESHLGPNPSYETLEKWPLATEH